MLLLSKLMRIQSVQIIVHYSGVLPQNMIVSLPAWPPKAKQTIA